MSKLKKRGLWCGASDAGASIASVNEFVDRVADAGFNLILPNLKQGHGRLCWPSRIHPDLVLDEYKEFDLPKHLLEACRRRSVEVHAWFIDFMEGADHLPEEWAMRTDLAAAYRAVAMYGWDDLVFTHISARVPGPEHHFLINPYGMMFEEITASSLVKVNLAGEKVMDSPFEINPAGFTIHTCTGRHCSS